MVNANRVGQRFHVGDRVRKKTLGGIRTPRTGKIVGVQQQLNSKKIACYYYQVIWDDLSKTKPSIHAQQALISLNDKTTIS